MRGSSGGRPLWAIALIIFGLLLLAGGITFLVYQCRGKSEEGDGGEEAE